MNVRARMQFKNLCFINCNYRNNLMECCTQWLIGCFAAHRPPNNCYECDIVKMTSIVLTEDVTVTCQTKLSPCNCCLASTCSVLCCAPKHAMSYRSQILLHAMVYMSLTSCARCPHVPSYADHQTHDSRAVMNSTAAATAAMA